MSGRAYITIVRWPKDFALPEKSQALADAMGIDPYTAALRVGPDAPVVVGLADESAAPAIVEKLKARKVTCFALTQTHIARLPRPSLVKRLTPAAGAADPMYMVELWREDSIGLRVADIFLLVRGTVDRSTLRTQVDGAKYNTAALAMGGLGMAMAMRGPAEVTRTTETRLSQLLDIYTLDHRLLRINSDRFSFDVLGKDRGFTAMENTDKVATLLTSQAPEALVDLGFSHFKPPPDFAGVTMTGSSSNSTTIQRDNSSTFDFYSGWTYTIQRALARR